MCALSFVYLPLFFIPPSFLSVFLVFFFLVLHPPSLFLFSSTFDYVKHKTFTNQENLKYGRGFGPHVKKYNLGHVWEDYLSSTFFLNSKNSCLICFLILGIPKRILTLLLTCLNFKRVTCLSGFCFAKLRIKSYNSKCSHSTNSILLHTVANYCTFITFTLSIDGVTGAAA